MHNCFYYGFHNTSHLLVLLLSCFDGAVDLSIVEMDNALFESFMRQNLSTVTVEMDKALLESFMRQTLSTVEMDKALLESFMRQLLYEVA